MLPLCYYRSNIRSEWSSCRSRMRRSLPGSLQDKLTCIEGWLYWCSSEGRTTSECSSLMAKLPCTNCLQRVRKSTLVSHVSNNNTPPYTHRIQSLSLPTVVTAVKDLGVMFDVKLNFNVHIHKIVVKALGCSNLIIKCVSFVP